MEKKVAGMVQIDSPPVDWYDGGIRTLFGYSPKVLFDVVRAKSHHFDLIWVL